VLFNTFAFATVFLPAALLGYFGLARYSVRWPVHFLFLASLAFYGYWSPAHLPLLLGSIGANYYVGRSILRARDGCNDRLAKTWLVSGLALNLGLLATFKYLDFLIANYSMVTGVAYQPLGLELPIGISFFTFTQIAYLVDCHSTAVPRYRLEQYGLFVTYFPHLIAGPILHHKDILPQITGSGRRMLEAEPAIIGLTIFSIGLFKKVVLADGVAPFVAPVFDISPDQLTTLEAWCGALAYTFQLYFDFSAYSDMAYGISYMFGIVLPINFLSPYKATSIIDFWRRWHISLSTFLRDYLYIPLGGNRKGPMRRWSNLLITMLLGGLWHGASWTFVIWGGLHGTYLILNHAARHVLGHRTGHAAALAGWLLTFLAVVVAWVFFRANTVESGLSILNAMIGNAYVHVGPNELASDRIMSIGDCLTWLATCGLIAFTLPNTYELLARYHSSTPALRVARFKSGLLTGCVIALSALLLAISETRGVSEFLYFNF